MDATAGCPQIQVMRVNKWKLGGTYEGGQEYDNPHTPIMVEKNWPDPEIRGKGVVISKDGKVKTEWLVMRRLSPYQRS